MSYKYFEIGDIVKRDIRIDALRALAIILIILAHAKPLAQPPVFLYQIRTFDVPLMAFLMGSSYVLSEQKNKKESFHLYLWKRFKRLVVPAWIFLTFFFVLMWFEYLFSTKDYPFTKDIIVTSYTLESGIGYVWIIRVFFIIAILSPIIYFIAKKSNTIVKTTMLLIVFLIIQTIFCDVSNGMIDGTKESIQNYIVIPFGYCIAAFVGMKASEQDINKNIRLSIIITAFFILTGFSVNFGQLQTFKYPPSAYYLTYGIGMSMILYTILSFKKIEVKISKLKFLTWLSKYSLELYYWHAIIRTSLNLIRPETSWRGRFVIFLVGSIVATAVQVNFFPNLFSGRFSLKKIN